jgi:hypothetical protein
MQPNSLSDGTSLLAGFVSKRGTGPLIRCPVFASGATCVSNGIALSSFRGGQNVGHSESSPPRKFRNFIGGSRDLVHFTVDI